MDKEAINRIFENINKLRKKINEIKKVKDYGISSTTIAESIIYPEIAKMRQDVWLNKYEKIEINYVDQKDFFEIILNFKNESIIQALEIITAYLSHWNNEMYADNFTIFLENKQLPILEYDQLCLKLNKKGLNLQESFEDVTYEIIDQGVWMDIEKTIKIIQSLEETEKITLKIKKIEGEESFWQCMSCIHISFNTKYYEDGYLEDIEWKRLEPLLMEWKSNNKQ